MKYTIVVEERIFEIEVTPEGQVWVDREPIEVDLEGVDGLPLYSLLVDHQSYETHLAQEDEGACTVAVSGRSYRASIQAENHLASPSTACSRSNRPAEIKAPLPGLLVEVRVDEKGTVEEGAVVAVLESMKMHLELRAPTAGRVEALHGRAGQEVGQGDVVAVIEMREDSASTLHSTMS